MKTVAIAGVGLIGGSFGLALRKAGFGGEILGISSPRAIEAALQAGAISRSGTLEEAAAAADLIYLAQPVDRILTTLETLGPLAHSGCLITDAGSTKAAIVRKASECVRAASFVGGHPLAGKEQRGVNAADSDLFRQRPYVLTPSHADTPGLPALRFWLLRMGAKIVELAPEEHDAALAWTSHLPQLLSSALAAVLAQQNDQHLTELFGPALLDMTRLALSSAELWQGIFATNKAEILSAVDAFVASLQRGRKAVEADDIGEFFDSAAGFARQIRNTSYESST